MIRRPTVCYREAREASRLHRSEGINLDSLLMPVRIQLMQTIRVS